MVNSLTCRFTQQFHLEKGFFYRNGENSYAPGANEQLIGSSASMLWEDLEEENPIKRKRDLEWEFRVELYRVTPEAPVQSDSELRAKIRKMNVQQAKKLNDIAIDRDLFKLYYRVAQKIDGSNQYDMDEFIKETIHDTNETWNEFLPPFQNSELRSLTQLHEMYANGGIELKNKLEEILAAEAPGEKKNKNAFSILVNNAFDMKKFFRDCLLKEERKEPLFS